MGKINLVDEYEAVIKEDWEWDGHTVIRSIDCRSESSMLPPPRESNPYKFHTYDWLRGMTDEQQDTAIIAVDMLRDLGLQVRCCQVDARYKNKSS